ncbi:hypothetical protein CGZ96_19300 [Enemella evansiae]|nr:hypothetical protein CGZ96_19300 [Enemella evansiae]OYN95306.1 hypothetical protein CGZ95_16325 [Enemella evansiae]OYO03409.1 hypothetical protein CGZ97_08090 [Enemella evansiae]
MGGGGVSDQLVTPVLRALDLLDWLAAGGNTDNLSEASRETGISRATLGRLLDTFHTAGVLAPSPAGTRFGGRMLRLAAAVIGDGDLTGAAAVTLPSVAADLGLSTYLVILDGEDAVYLQQHLPDAPLVSNIGVGSRVPAAQVAPGRILLGMAEEVAWSRSGLESGVGAAAIGIRHRGEFVGAISVAGPQAGVDAVADRIEPVLLVAAQDISARLG